MNIYVLILTTFAVVFALTAESIAQECDCDCEEELFGFDVEATWPQFQKKHIVRPTATPTTWLGWNDLLRERCPKDFNNPRARLKNSFIDEKTPNEIETDIKDSLNRYQHECNRKQGNDQYHKCFWSKCKHRIIQMVKIPNSPNPRVQYDIYVCPDRYFIANRSGISQPNHFDGFSKVDSGVKEPDEEECSLLS